MDRVNFTKMSDGTIAEYQFLSALEQDHAQELPNRIIENLLALKGSLAGYRVDRLEHSLQTATRARRQGADKELVAAALIHDIGDGLAPFNHARLAASIIAPYVRKQVSWIVDKHGVFQMKYYADKLGQDPDMRDQYKDHIWFKDCAEFCEQWDQVSFDPDFKSDPLDDFIPLITEIFTRPPHDPNILGDGPTYDQD